VSNYACIDADGRYGSHATVYTVHDTAESALGRAREPGLQAIEITDAEVGDRIQSNAIGRVYPRVRAYRYDAEVYSDERKAFDRRSLGIIGATSPDNAETLARRKHRLSVAQRVWITGEVQS
jgi:hypothetical protein